MWHREQHRGFGFVIPSFSLELPPATTTATAPAPNKMYSQDEEFFFFFVSFFCCSQFVICYFTFGAILLLLQRFVVIHRFRSPIRWSEISICAHRPQTVCDERYEKKKRDEI